MKKSVIILMILFVTGLIVFADTSSGENVSYWEWDFDHDEIIDSYEQNPEYCFADSGTYRVSLCINDGYPDFIDEKYAERIIQVNGINSSSEEQVPVAGIELNNYPNTFNSSTTISYSLPSRIKIPIIEIYNLRGQLVSEFKIDPSSLNSTVTGKLRIGYVVWDGTGFASGIYLYKLYIKNSPIKKMILLKITK